MFRTNILAPEKKKAIRTQSIEDYDHIVDGLATRHENTMGKQPGNPQIAVERILDMVMRKGMMSGVETLPLRVILGSDALDILRQECEETLETIKRFEEFSRSTNFDDIEEPQAFQ